MKKTFFSLMVVSFLPQLSSAQESWVNFQYRASNEKLMANISRSDTPPGFIVASPSKSDPNYYFHWVRDAALVMSALQQSLPFEKQKPLFVDYIKLVNQHQQIWKITGQGEPKFNPDGTSFSLPWGRPQNDGPALRSIVLVRHALELIKTGQTDYVKSHLYGGKIPANTVIKRDLEYVSHNWRKHDFDLWEEVKGHHFYTRYVQRSALVLGAQLAEQLGDNGAAVWYRKQAAQLSQELEKHWSAEKNYILSTRNRVDGLPYKHTNLDASIILAVNHASLPGLSFSVTDERVIATAWELIDTFKDIYPINSKFEGVGIGRYPEDRYFGGNPWFLLTAGLGEYLFKLANEYKSKPKFNVSIISKKFFKKFLGYEFTHSLIVDQLTTTQIVSKLNARGDQFLNRIRRHAYSDGRLDEQFDKYTGFMKGARDLTWSYAAFLTSVNAKRNGIDAKVR